MSNSSNIEWTEATWNPVVGCTRVSEGCDHCYAVGMTRRLEGAAKGGGGQLKNKTHQYVGLTVKQKPAAIEKGIGVGGYHFNGVVRCVESALDAPLHWREPRRIFVNSMSDLFHKKVPFEFIDKVFAVMALCPQHTFQVLTKRPERMLEYMDGLAPHRIGNAARATCGRTPIKHWGDLTGRSRIEGGATERAVDAWSENGGVLPNVWLGASIENQKTADERIPHLLRVPAAVRWLSVEPMLVAVDLYQTCMNRGGWTGDPAYQYPASAGVQWVVCGGESGPGARPFDVAWARSLRDQCAAAGVPFFMKQLGGHIVDRGPWVKANAEWPTETLHDEHETPNGWRMRLIDRKGGDMAEWPEDLRVREMPGEGGKYGTQGKEGER